MKQPYLKQSMELIKNISKTAKDNRQRLKEVILWYAQDFSDITNAIKQINQYKPIIEPAGKVGWSEIKEGLKDKIKDDVTIFEFFFLDLLQIMEKCHNPYQIAMAICRNIPLIDRGIKEYRGE